MLGLPQLFFYSMYKQSYRFIFVLIFSNVSFVLGQQIKPTNFQQYVCYTTKEPIIIDGILDEESWKKALSSNSFVDIEGSKMPLPLYDTKIKMLWDEDNLYISAWIEETHIWATYTERESIIFHENDFEIFIDPNGDTHNYYEIEINALNTIWDLLLTKPYKDYGRPIKTWDVKGMKTAVHTEGTINDPSDTDDYWSVEIALPWNSLKEYAFEAKKPKDGEQWRMNFSRVQWRLDIINGTYKKQINPQTNETFPEYNWVWSPQGIINMHHPETWGYVQFSKRLVGNNKAEFVFCEEELIKWELRKIYYAQKDFKSKNGQYANKLESLDVKIENCNNPFITISTFSNRFEASLKCDCSSKIWYIRQDSKVWYAED